MTRNRAGTLMQITGEVVRFGDLKPGELFSPESPDTLNALMNDFGFVALNVYMRTNSPAPERSPEIYRIDTVYQAAPEYEIRRWSRAELAAWDKKHGVGGFDNFSTAPGWFYREAGDNEAAPNGPYKTKRAAKAALTKYEGVKNP